MIPVVDVFAGPGGLGEGFSAFRDEDGKQVFKIALSIEKDPAAYDTLVLRSFFRQFADSCPPAEYYEQLRTGKIDWAALSKKHPEAAKKAEHEVWNATLGGSEYPPKKVDRRIRKALNKAKLWVLIGGPPCQVYSQVGRSRIRGESAWHFARDERHLLYKEYLRIIAVHKPPFFVMENVKGLLSSKKAGKKIIRQIVADLQNPTNNLKLQKNKYRLFALADYANGSGKRGNLNGDDPSKYVIRCERHGIPQARHRLILLGIRSDIQIEPKKLVNIQSEVNISQAIGDLPVLRSRLSNLEDSPTAWVKSIQKVMKYRTLDRAAYQPVGKLMKELSPKLDHLETGGEYLPCGAFAVWNKDWFFDERLQGVCNHSARSHIYKDLWRYFYATCFASLNQRSPVLKDFPRFLLPAHSNVEGKKRDDDQPFADRFRVQLKHRPSTTVTSHIGKDGHYFIHFEPLQCRSLTVREAARLQTFPDNYFFRGTRTQQYQQVGNAVPPLLARQIAEIVLDVLQQPLS